MKLLIQHILTVFALGFSACAATAAGLDDLVAALETAAANGDPKAQTDLAVRYEHAEGVAKDFQKANMLYCQAARQGYPEGQFKLGWVYANGRGVPRVGGQEPVEDFYADRADEASAIALVRGARPVS